jgi:O-antigen ligase
MTQIELSVLETHNSDETGAHHQRSRGSRLNRVMMWVLLALVALAPLPLGSNRPFLWGVTATIVGLMALLYGWFMIRRREDLRAPVASLGVQTGLFALYVLFLIVQTLPLGSTIGPLPVGAIDGLMLTGPAISVAPGATLLMLVRAVTYGLVFFLVMQVAVNDQRRNRMIDALLVIVVIHALIGLASLRLGDTILGFEKWAYIGSATGTFVNRNSFATFLAMGGVIAFTQMIGAIATWMDQRRDGEHGHGILSEVALYGVALAVIVAAVVATQSRMGFMVTLGGIVMVALLSALRGDRRLTIALIVVPIVLVGGGLTFLFYGQGLIDRLGNLEDSTIDRAGLYAQILNLIQLRPWTGFGGGSFEIVYPLIHQVPVSPDVVWDKAHNSYLALWTELGFVFGSIPILILGWTFARLIAAMFGGRGSWRAQAIALGVITVGALHSLVDFSLEIQADTLLFLALTAVGLATTVKSASNKDS